jgi:hypothetical protein
MAEMNARVTVVQDQNRLILQRILELGEGNYVLTVNQARNVESDEQDDGRETNTLGKKRKKK